MEKSVIEKMLDTWQVEGISKRAHADLLEKVLEESKLIQELKDLDYYMCDDDRLPQCVAACSKLIENDRNRLIDAYQYRVSQTMRSLARVQDMLAEELIACSNLQENIKNMNRVKW